MSTILSTLKGAFEKPIVKYIINNFFGLFFAKKVTVDNLSLDLTKGKAEVNEIQLKVETLNKQLSTHVPLKLTYGFVQQFKIHIPWSTIFQTSFSIHLEGAQLSVCLLNYQFQQSESLMSSMSKSFMASSMEIAEDVYQQSTKIDAIDKIAQSISTMMRRFKFSANNTSVKFSLPEKNHEIELRIEHINVEDEEVSFDNKIEKPSNSSNSDITKRITVKGIEILINGTVVTKLNGNHSIHMQLESNRIDITIHLSSYLFAIINSDHLKVLMDFIKVIQNNSIGEGVCFGLNEKPLTPHDYQQMKLIEMNETKRLNAMSSSMLSFNNRNWTSSSHEEEDRFMPFNQNTTAHKTNNEEDSSVTKNIRLKVPGIMLCLVSDTRDVPVFEEMPMLEQSSLLPFIGINNFLDEKLKHYHHLRISASNLNLDFTSEALDFTCTHLNVYEHEINKGLNTIFSVNDDETNSMKSTVKLKMVKNNLNLTLDSSNFKIDPRLLERHHELFNVFVSSNSNKISKPKRIYNNFSQDDLNLTIDCEKLEIEMLFPIPDLRKDRPQYSSVHDEVLLVELKNFQLTLHQTESNLVCSSIEIGLKVDEKKHIVFHSQSEERQIGLHFSTAPTPVRFNDDLERSFLPHVSMHESINPFSAINQQKNTNDPFVENKKEIISLDDNVKIITPGDRIHLENYLSSNRDNTKFYMRINIPDANFHLNEKKLFELIYNRFVNDLVLWTPRIPQRKVSFVGSESNSLIQSNNIFTSAITDLPCTFLDSSQNQNLTDDSMFFSTVPPSSVNLQTTSFYNIGRIDDSTNSQNTFHSIEEEEETGNILKQSNEFLLELEVDHLTMDFHTSTGRKNTISTQNLLLGIIIGPEAERETTLCMSTERVDYQCDEKRVLTGNSYTDSKLDQQSHNCEVNMAMKIKRENDKKKTIKLAVQLKQALLLGLDLSVFEDVFEFVNLKDDEILGYVCPKVILELHTDIFKCGIFFDVLRERSAVLTVDEIYLTSLVVEQTNQTILQFFIEEARLSFKRSELSLDVFKNYISVIHSSYIHLNLKLSKDSKTEYKMSNNELKIRICPDSCACLLSFLEALGSQFTPKGKGLEFEEPSKEIVARKESFNGTELMTQALNEIPPEDKKNDCDEDEENSFNYADPLNCSYPFEESGYLLLEDAIGTGIQMNTEPQGRLVGQLSMKIDESFFPTTNYNVIPELTLSTLSRIFLEKFSITISIFTGKDFDDIPSDVDEDCYNNTSKMDVVSQTNVSIRSGHSGNHRESKVHFQQNSVMWENIDLVSNNNGYVGNDGLTPAENPSFRGTGGINRKNDACVQLKLDKIKVLFDQFDKDNDLAWRFLLFVEEYEIIDQVNASDIKKLLYELVSESTPRRKYSNMFSVKLNCKRNFQDNTEECDIAVSMKSLRANLDQDTLQVLMEFFNDTQEILAAKLSSGPNVNSTRSHADSESSEGSVKKPRCDSKTSVDVDMSVNSDEDCEVNTSGPSSFSNTEPLLNNGFVVRDCNNNAPTPPKIFIKSFTFSPSVQIVFDYKGKHVNMDQGGFGVFLGVSRFNHSTVKLKKLSNKHGLLGWDKVVEYALDEWIKDIKRNQVPAILGGVGPMYMVIQLFQGVRDLFWLPFDQYRRDQRLIRGLQRGFSAFSVSALIASIEGLKGFFSLLECTALFVHDIVTPPGNNYRSGQMMITLTQQPRDVREGFTQCIAQLKEGLTGTVRNVTNAGIMSDDVPTRVGEVVRILPSSIIRPVIVCTQATNSVLVGMRNQITPEARKDDQEKWKNANKR